jgi:hypothetical protein
MLLLVLVLLHIELARVVMLLLVPMLLLMALLWVTSVRLLMPLFQARTALLLPWPGLPLKHMVLIKV